MIYYGIKSEEISHGRDFSDFQIFGFIHDIYCLYREKMEMLGF